MNASNYELAFYEKLLSLLHDHPYYHVNQDILSLVSDPLSGNGCGSPNHTYAGCPRRNGQNFGRVFLMLNYTDITQNTYIQS